MFTVSTNSFIRLTDRLFFLPLLLLFLLPSHLLRHPFAVEADGSIDPTCKTANEYLDAMYRCRASEFQVISYCASQPLHELTCNKTGKMAIFNASIGRSSDRICSHSSSSVFHGSTARASECCLLSTVENKCHGKIKCNLNAVDLLHSTDAEPCVSRRDIRQTEHRIMIVFICVNQKTFRELKRDQTEPDAFCDGQTETGDGGGGGGGGGGNDEATDTLSRRKSVHPVRSEGLPTTTAADTPSPHPVPPTADASDPTSPDQEEFETEQSESTAVYRSAGSLDWIWAIIFIRDNMDKFLIYLFLSIAVGVILVLLIVVLGLCFGRCWKRHRQSKKKELTVDGQGVTRSSAQTNDDDTASPLMMTATAAGHHSPQDGTELVRYDQTDSYHRRPVTPSRANGNSSLAPGNSVRFASPDNFGEQAVRRTGNPGPTNLNLPQYQIASSSDSTDGDDRVVERQAGHNNDDDDDDDYRSNTLGRFYSNPYRHDSYRADDYRTFQHR